METSTNRAVYKGPPKHYKKEGLQKGKDCLGTMALSPGKDFYRSADQVNYK